MKFLNWIIKGSIGSFRILYALLAVVVILTAAYVLGGHEFLARQMWGSDMKSALAMVAWVDKYFPHVPFWYPLAGGGVSITHSYPVFSFYLVALLKRLTSLDLVQAFGVLGFSSVPLMALGIYAFVSLRFRNQTAALIASVLYLVSPIAWTWLVDWGFYAECVSHIFVMPAIIFWDLFFTSFLDDTARVRSRVYLILTVIFLSLALLSHFGTGFGLMGFFGFYVLGYTLKAKERKKTFVRGVLALFLVGILASAVTAFTTLPYYRYMKIAAQAGLPGGPNLEQLKESELSPLHILSFQPAVTASGQYLAIRHISFPAVVSLLAILGVLLSFLNPRHLAFGLFAAFALTLSINARFIFWILNHVPSPLYALLVWRFVSIPLRMVLPALAALGAIGIFKIPFFWIRGRFGSFIKGFFASLAGLAFVVFALYQFGHLPKPEGFPLNYGARGLDLRNIWNKKLCFSISPGECIEVDQDICLAENSFLYRGDESGLREFEAGGSFDREWCHSALRPYFISLPVRDWCRRAKDAGETLPELCDLGGLTDEKVRSFWQKCKEDEGFSLLCGLRFKSLGEQLSLSEWPKFAVADASYDPTANPKVGDPGWLSRYRVILDKVFKENPSARIDFPPYEPTIAMFAPYHNLDRDLSQLYIYTVGSSSLIQRFWGQQVSAFYLDDPFYGEDPNFINNLAHWFGINYIFVEKSTELELFQKAGWEPWELWDVDGERRVLKFPEENLLTDLSEKTAVMVVGQNNVDAYGQVFRLASYGAIPYADAFVIWGKGAVDSYSLEELQSFDVLVLHGYTYGSQAKTNTLLSAYVRGGGKLFIDTGWQYTTPDWKTPEGRKALEIIPFEKLSWKNLGKTSDFVLEDDVLGGGVDLSKFAPLIYEDQPWNVSTGERSDLRDWARVVLSVKDYPLVVAGELGEGKVVWSGMNIFAHAKQREGPLYEEVEFLTNLFSWLTGGASTNNFKVTYTRDHPDKVAFTAGGDVPNGGYLLWKEAYYPDFHARLITNNQSPITNLKIYRSGPGFALIKVPELKEGDKIIYEYHKPFVEKASTWVSLLTILFLPVIVVEGVLTKEKSLFLRLVQTLEGKLHHLFFELWKKPSDWWEKKEEDE